jgi:hypothetical protein
MHVTVFSPGGPVWRWAVVGLLHVLCWLLGIGFGFATFFRLDDLGGDKSASNRTKNAALAAPFVSIAAVVAVLLHSSLAIPPKNAKSDGISMALSVTLLAANLAALAMSFAVVAACAENQDNDAHRFSEVASAFVTIAIMMVVAFYVNYTRNGDNFLKATSADMPA